MRHLLTILAVLLAVLTIEAGRIAAAESDDTDFSLYLPSVVANRSISDIHHSQPRFQVFILNPVRTCLVGNDFASGTLCRGANCGDCSCTWEQFDPPAPLRGVSPDNINDPEYADYAYRECVEITLTDNDVTQIIDDMEMVSEEVLEWTDGALIFKLRSSS